jgi:hypothetical protein
LLAICHIVIRILLDKNKRMGLNVRCQTSFGIIVIFSMIKTVFKKIVCLSESNDPVLVF